MKVRTALLELFKESHEWRVFLRSCCETSAFKLRSQAWQFRDELNERGNQFRMNEVEDALFGLAHDLLPDTPAAQWDAEWAHELCKGALARLNERWADLTAEERDSLDLSGRDFWEELMRVADEANDPPAYRAALKGWEHAALEALDAAKQESGMA